MPYGLVNLYQHLPLFVLVVSRLGGLLMFQPVWTSMMIPVRLRAMITLALAALITPFVPFPANLPTNFAALFLAGLSELLLGVVLGLALQIAFLGIQFGGLIIAQQSGLAFGQIADPSTGDRQSIIAAFYLNVAAVVYLVLGGHRVVVAVCLDTFDAIPLLAGAERLDAVVDLLFDALNVSLLIAIRLSAPALLTVMLATVAIGFIGRTIPQINIATVGFSIKSLIVFAIMAVALPAGMEAFIDGVNEIGGWLTDLLNT